MHLSSRFKIFKTPCISKAGSIQERLQTSKKFRTFRSKRRGSRLGRPNLHGIMAPSLERVEQKLQEAQKNMAVALEEKQLEHGMRTLNG